MEYWDSSDTCALEDEQVDGRCERQHMSAVLPYVNCSEDGVRDQLCGGYSVAAMQALARMQMIG